MLVVTRKVDETVVIRTDDGDVTVTVLRIDSDKIRIGVDAPLSMAIRRGELPSDYVRKAAVDVP